MACTAEQTKGESRKGDGMPIGQHSKRGQAALVSRYVQAAPLTEGELQLRLQQMLAQATSQSSPREANQQACCQPVPQPHSKSKLPLVQLLKIAMGGAQHCGAAGAAQQKQPVSWQPPATQLQLEPAADKQPQTHMLSPTTRKMEDAAHALVSLQQMAVVEPQSAGNTLLQQLPESHYNQLRSRRCNTILHKSGNEVASSIPEGQLEQCNDAYLAMPAGATLAHHASVTDSANAAHSGLTRQHSQQTASTSGAEDWYARHHRPARQHKHKWARPGKGYTRKQEVADLLNKVVEIPAPVFNVHMPDIYYRARVIGPDKQHAKAVVVRTLDDRARYYFPIGQVREWLHDTLARHESQQPCTSLLNSIHSEMHRIQACQHTATSQVASIEWSDRPQHVLMDECTYS